MKRLLTLLALLLLSAPVAAHHTKEHLLQSSVVTAPPPAPAESDAQLWYALGPFFLLAVFGFVRWGLKYRATRRPRRD